MTNQEMKQEFLNITANYCSVKAEDMKPEMRFLEDLEFSSFDFMAYLGDLEDEFDVEVDETEASQLRTIEDAMNYIDSLSNE